MYIKIIDTILKKGTELSFKFIGRPRIQKAKSCNENDRPQKKKVMKILRWRKKRNEKSAGTYREGTRTTQKLWSLFYLH